MKSIQNYSGFFTRGAILLLLSLTGSLKGSAQASQGDLYAQTSEVNDLMIQYRADYGNLSRFYEIENSPERRQRLSATVKEYLDRVRAIPFETLSQGGRVDYILFQRDLKEEAHRLMVEEKQVGQIQKWIPFSDSIYLYEKSRRRGAILDAPRFASDLNAWSNQIKALQISLSSPASSLSFELGTCTEASIEGLRHALKSINEFYNGYDPQFSWWVPQPYHITDSLLEAYGKAVHARKKTSSAQKPDSTGIAGNPIGQEELKRRLAFELIPYSPEELVAIANREFAWCDQEMLKASREMGFGDNWKAALEKVKNSFVPAGEQPMAMLKLYNESVAFIKNHDLITLPPLAEETWRMVMMTPERQLVNPFFTGGEEFSISYPTTDMKEADKLMSMRGNNPHFSRATVHHELLAGHALQEFMTSRYKTYRHFDTPFWVEGWSLYWEMLLWDQGFAQTPEDRIGMLFWRMHRCARIIFSLNYHTGKWTPAQCIDFLVNRVGHERANAEGEVRRSFVGGYDPLYQVAYMIGGLQIMALKHEVVDSHQMTFRQFHDRFLQENMMPIELFRAIITQQPLTRDYQGHWKFYHF